MKTLLKNKDFDSCHVTAVQALNIYNVTAPATVNLKVQRFSLALSLMGSNRSETVAGSFSLLK